MNEVPAPAPDHALELSVAVEDLVGAMSHVDDDDPTVGHDGDIRRVAEFPRTVAPAAELAHKVSGGAYDDDARCHSVEYVQVPVAVERHAADATELLPRFASGDPDPIHLLEVDLEPAVVARKFDDLLSGDRSRRRRDRRGRQQRRGQVCPHRAGPRRAHGRHHDPAASA